MGRGLYIVSSLAHSIRPSTSAIKEKQVSLHCKLETRYNQIMSDSEQLLSRTRSSQLNLHCVSTTAVKLSYQILTVCSRVPIEVDLKTTTPLPAASLMPPFKSVLPPLLLIRPKNICQKTFLSSILIHTVECSVLLSDMFNCQ